MAFSRPPRRAGSRSEEHTSELQSQSNLVCRLLLEKKKYEESSPTPLDLILRAPLTALTVPPSSLIDDFVNLATHWLHTQQLRSRPSATLPVAPAFDGRGLLLLGGTSLVPRTARRRGNRRDGLQPGQPRPSERRPRPRCLRLEPGGDRGPPTGSFFQIPGRPRPAVPCPHARPFR